MNKAQTKNEYVPDYIVTPGAVLEDYLEDAGITKTMLAEKTGLSNETINDILTARSSITTEIAKMLEELFDRPAHFWSNLERQYQEDKARLTGRIQLKAPKPALTLTEFNVKKYSNEKSLSETVRALP